MKTVPCAHCGEGVDVSDDNDIADQMGLICRSCRTDMFGSSPFDSDDDESDDEDREDDD